MKFTIDTNIPEYVINAIDVLEKIMIGNQNEGFNMLMKITRGEAYVLKMLLLNNGPISPSELTELLGTTKGRISSILRTLEGKGEISRDTDINNRRNTIVNITDAGRKRIVSELLEIRGKLIHAFTEIGEADANEFSRIAPRLFEFMKQ